MKKSNTYLANIAQVAAHISPEVIKQAEDMCAPMLKKTHLIPQIYSKIKETFPELDKTDESILFTTCVYSAYAPSTLLWNGIGRAPNGIRKIMCEIMQWKDAPTVNYYCQIGRAYFKNPKHKARMATIMMGFEQFSVKPNQISLF